MVNYEKIPEGYDLRKIVQELINHIVEQPQAAKDIINAGKPNP
jgi:hypothetical protein